MRQERSRVDLYWIPLGAGGHFVAFNGRVYEAIKARLDHRERLDIYHSALVVTLPVGSYVIEDAWPIPDGNGWSRGIVTEGSVGHRLLGRARAFRYEVRRWREGVIADITEAVASPQVLSYDELVVRRVLEVAENVPPLIWGRKPQGFREMWNSNSVISWVLARAGVDLKEIHLPPHGRAPGWQTGIWVAGKKIGEEFRHVDRNREWAAPTAY